MFFGGQGNKRNFEPKFLLFPLDSSLSTLNLGVQGGGAAAHHLASERGALVLHRAVLPQRCSKLGVVMMGGVGGGVGREVDGERV